MASSSTRSSKSVSGLEKRPALPVSFYRRHTLEVARDLLGKVLLVKDGRSWTGGRIIETEAYRADDPASHSAKGKTPRAATMFGPPGVAYVYFIYGMYEMLNFVTEPEGEAGAVLIRALEPLVGEDRMRERRRAPRSRHDLTAGPGKLCRALGIRMSHNGASLRGPELRVVDDGWRPESISVSPRVGISAGKEEPWRFFVTAHPFVSRAPQNHESVVLGNS